MVGREPRKMPTPMQMSAQEVAEEKSKQASLLVQCYLNSVIVKALEAPETKAGVDYILAAHDAVRCETTIQKRVRALVRVTAAHCEKPARWSAPKVWTPDVPE